MKNTILNSMILFCLSTLALSCSSPNPNPNPDIDQNSLPQVSNKISDPEDLERVNADIAKVNKEIVQTDSLIGDLQKRLEQAKKAKTGSSQKASNRYAKKLESLEEQRSKLENRKLDLETEIWLFQ